MRSHLFLRRFFLLFFFLSSLFCEAKPPQLTPRDVKMKVDEIFKSHVCYKGMSPEIMQRTLQNFLEELDPTKTYFLQGEIVSFLEPSSEFLQRAILGLQSADFSFFYEIHKSFLKTVERRNILEEELLQRQLFKGVKSEEFKDLKWALTEEELIERLLRIKSLQLEATEKLGDETQTRFLQRAKKRRLNRELELSGNSVEERTKVALSFALKAIASALDSHTTYFTPSEANQFMIQVQQRLFGIGAQLRDDLDGLSVTRILENSPASQTNKLKIYDKIIAVDKEPVVGMEISEAVELIRGEKGTPVLLTLLREKGEGAEKEIEKLEIELIRNEVVLEETRLETEIEPYADGVIATLKLFSFYQDPKSSSSSDIRKAIEQIKKEYVLKGVMLDLRSNAGGFLDEAANVSGLFLNKGIVVSVKEHTGKLRHWRELEGKPIWDGPLFVLVNRASASAAEIVAQTLQDYGRAFVAGDKTTFGKGSFQTFTLDSIHHPKVNPQGEYKVTRGIYYTVSGKSPQLTGVVSDLVIPGILSELDVGEKFSKFPLPNDQIEPHFEDDLSDLPPFQRIQLGLSYKSNLQQRLTTYTPFLEQLKKNSQARIQANKSYQKVLSELKKKNFDTASIDIFEQTDLQLLEAYNAMKDLIFLLSVQER